MPVKRETLDQIFARIGKENVAREKRLAGKKGAALLAEASRLKWWSKGKPIVRQTSDSTFWRSGKWMTNLNYKTVDAMVEKGLARIDGKSTEAGCTIYMT